jgi:hypothetical protein
MDRTPSDDAPFLTWSARRQAHFWSRAGRPGTGSVSTSAAAEPRGDAGARRCLRRAREVARGGPLAEWREPTGELDATDKDVSIGGAGLAAAAIKLGLVDELRMFRNPVLVGGGTPFLPPVSEWPRWT